MIPSKKHNFRPSLAVKLGCCIPFYVARTLLSNCVTSIVYLVCQTNYGVQCNCGTGTTHLTLTSGLLCNFGTSTTPPTLSLHEKHWLYNSGIYTAYCTEIVLSPCRCSTKFGHNFLASLHVALGDVLGDLLRSRWPNHSLDPDLVGNLPKNRSLAHRIPQVHGAQSLAEVRPEPFNWVQVWRSWWDLPQPQVNTPRYSGFSFFLFFLSFPQDERNLELFSHLDWVFSSYAGVLSHVSLLPVIFSQSVHFSQRRVCLTSPFEVSHLDWVTPCDFFLSPSTSSNERYV